MDKKEIAKIIKQVGSKPDSSLAKFILDPKSNAEDLIDFMSFVDTNTFILDRERYWGTYKSMYDNDLSSPVTYNELVEKYLSSSKKQ